MENDVFCKVYDGQCIGDPGDASSMRGWLNFDYIYNIEHYTQPDPLRRTVRPTTNANDIRRYITGETPTPPIFLGTQPIPAPPEVPEILFIDGDFIHGEPGQKQSATQDIFSFWAGQTVFLPVFDVVYAPNYMEDHPEYFPVPHVDSGQTWPNQNQYLYHIVGFVAAVICDPATNPACQGNPHDIVGTFEEYITAGQIDPRRPIPCDATLTAVVLWE